MVRYPCRSNLDHSDGYHNIRVHPQQEKHTACITTYGTYSTSVMLQGDCNAVAPFQKIMNNPFKDEWGIDVYVYIHDIFIFRNTYNKHLAHVRTVLLRLKDQRFAECNNKSQFLPDILCVLGHVITKTDISPLPQEVTKMEDWPYSQKRQELQSFLEMVNDLHQFPPNLAPVSSPLTEHAASTATWDCTHLYSKSFQEVNNTLAADVAGRPLKYNSTEPIYLVTDGSLIGTGT